MEPKQYVYLVVINLREFHFLATGFNNAYRQAQKKVQDFYKARDHFNANSDNPELTEYEIKKIELLYEVDE